MKATPTNEIIKNVFCFLISSKIGCSEVENTRDLVKILNPKFCMPLAGC